MMKNLIVIFCIHSSSFDGMIYYFRIDPQYQSKLLIKILSPSHWNQRKEAQQKSLRPLHDRPIGIPRVTIKPPIDPSR